MVIIEKNIVVIPVNTSFDTHVSKAIDNDPYPLVSNTTLHGMFLERWLKANNDLENLINQINKTITKKEIGGISRVNHINSTFYLLAISKFDDKNKACATKENLIQSIESLINYYDTYGQGYDLYMPLFGTGRSRINLTFQESLELILRTLKTNKNNIHGNIKIVIQEANQNKINLRGIFNEL